jgi:hypothetical protein
VLPILSLLVQGCSREEEHLTAVWADDGAGIATYRLVQSCPVPVVPLPMKVAPCEPERAELEVDGAAPWRVELDGWDLYWMRSQGYLLLVGLDRAVLYDDRSGLERLGLERDTAVIPSPDGQVLARVTSYAERWWVEMLRASDGALLAQVGVPLAQGAYHEGYTWTPSGRFVVQTDPDNGRAVAISVDGTTEEVDEPGCQE